MNSETPSIMLRTHTGRTEECFQNLLGEKLENRPLMRIFRPSTTNKRQTRVLKQASWRHRRVHLMHKSQRLGKRLTLSRRKRESNKESKLMLTSSRDNGMREIKPRITVNLKAS